MTYSEKLKDPRWQKKRLEILERDQWKCTLCKDYISTLHVHHEEYNGEPWEADSDKLKTLCECCHFLIENTKDKFIKIINLKKWGHDPSVYFLFDENYNPFWLLIDLKVKRLDVIGLYKHNIPQLLELLKGGINGEK